MTTINVTLLLGFLMKKHFSEKNDTEKGKKKNKKEGTAKDLNENARKKETDNKIKNQKVEESVSKAQVVEEEPIIVKPSNLFEVGRPQKFAHIEYVLLPQTVPFKIDVNCWENFAKIYCEDDVRVIRIKQVNEIAWVPVKVKHFFTRMTKSELLQLQFHVIKFTIWSQYDKLGSQARSEKANAFYIYQEHLKNDDIVEAFEKPTSDQKRYKDYLREERMNAELRLFNKCAFRNNPKMYSLAYLNYFADEVHDYMINKIIEDINNGIAIKCKEFVRVWYATSNTNLTVLPNESTSKEQPKKKKDQKKKEIEKQVIAIPVTITVSGEVFFTTPNLSIHQIDDTPVKDHDVYNGYVLLTIKNLMTREQKTEMNPLVIKIKKLMKLPVNVLSKHGFQWIRTRYNVPQVAQCITTEKPIAETIYINESHVFFLENTPESVLYDFFYTKQFIIEVVGIRKTKQKEFLNNASLFGTDNKDTRLSKRLQPMKCLKNKLPEEKISAVQLAVASYDISALLQCSCLFNMEAPCKNPDSAMSIKISDPLLFTDIINAQELNLDCFKETSTVSFLTDDILMDFGTSIILEMFLQAPQSSILKWHTLPLVFQRLLVITSDDLLATNLINQILLHNQKFYTTEIITADYLKTGIKAVLDKESSNIYFINAKTYIQEVVTGFLLDNVTSYIFYIEGMPSGLITKIWNQVMDLPLSVAVTHFNTKQVFSNRLYEELLPFGGFYVITLQATLKKIMAQTHLYLKGNAPLPCWEALKRFDLLLRTKVIKDMTQLNLFPSTKQLLSLDIEFGVPLRTLKRVEENSQEHVNTINE